MKSKNLLILAAIVLVVFAYIVFFERHRPTSDEAASAAEKVLLDFEQDDVAAILIERGESRVLREKSGDVLEVS